MFRGNSAFSIVRCDGARMGWSLQRILDMAVRVVDELGLSKSKPVSSRATGDGVVRFQDDESKPLDEEEKRLYQRIVAKLNCLAHDRVDVKYSTCCLASAASSPSTGDMREAKRVEFSRKAPVARQDFFLHDPRLEELLCYTDVDWAWDKISRRSMSGGVVILGGGVLNCWANKLKSTALSNRE